MRGNINNLQRCPSCGRCPTCGRSNTIYASWQWIPQPYYWGGTSGQVNAGINTNTFLGSQTNCNHKEEVK